MKDSAQMCPPSLATTHVQFVTKKLTNFLAIDKAPLLLRLKLTKHYTIVILLCPDD